MKRCLIKIIAFKEKSEEKVLKRQKIKNLKKTVLDYFNKDKLNLVPQMFDNRINVKKIKYINLLLIDLFLLAC